MCSSPKSSGGSAPKIRVKGFFEEMDPQHRSRFTEVANRADDRRAQRLQTNKRWKAKQGAVSVSPGIRAWFAKLVTHRLLY